MFGQTFRFKTRLQRLNAIEASSRAKLNFLEQLYRFHKQQGNPRVAVPTINHKPLDLWLLRKEVHRLGGYEAVSPKYLYGVALCSCFSKVTRGKKWTDLGRVLGYRGIPGLSTQIKNSYTRVILPFEHFCERAKNSPAIGPLISRDAQLKSHINHQGTSMKAEGSMTLPASPRSGSSSPLSEPPDDSEGKDSKGRPRRSTRMSSVEQCKCHRFVTLLRQSHPPLAPRKVAPVVPAPTFYDKPDNQKAKEEVSTVD